MSRNEMVRVPRELLDASAEWLEALSDPNSAERGVAQDLREILAQPAEQNQGEPVARYSMDQTGCEELDPDGHWVRYDDMKHADPGEVEQLRADLATVKADRDAYAQNAIDLRGIIRMHEKTVREQADHLAYMRAKLAEMTTKRDRLREGMDNANININNWFKDNQKLEAQLAERDALLREAINGKTRTQFDGDLMHRILMALSDSAEPSAPSPHPINMKTVMQAYEQVDHKALLHGTSNWCASMATALRGVIHSESTAPVERDERAEFEADWAARHGIVTDVGARNSFYRLQPLGRYRWPDVQNGWDAWQARAALERKPS